MSDILVSAVLCHHRGRLIDKAIDSLVKSKGVELQIIVVTSDETYKDDRVRVVYQHGGPALKRNVGFKFAEHQLIAFFDDDIEVRPWTVFYMATVLKRDGIGMVFGKLLNMEFTDRYDEAGSYLTSSGFLWARAESGVKDTGQFENIVPILAGKSASCMIRRRVFAEVGMFDVSYEILAEETLLSWKVWLWGYNVLYVPQSVTLHAFNTRFKPKDMYVPKRIYWNGSRNYITMLLTCLNGFNCFRILPIHISVWILSAIGMLLTGKFIAGTYIFKGLWYVVANFKLIMQKRKFIQSHRKISDIELFKTIMKKPSKNYYINRFLRYIKLGMHG